MTDGRYAIGLLSGTSLDGVDAACCRVDADGSGRPAGYDVEVVAFHTREYPKELRGRLRAACREGGTVEEACRLNVALGELFADAAAEVLEAAGVAPKAVAVAGSHGQTVRHLPEPEPHPGTDRRSRSTLQLGDGDVIAERLGIRTVSDFRARDVAAGGHGAPLAPVLDLALLAHPEEFRVAQNVGGIGNCTLLPPGGDRAAVRAFDTGPGNVVVDEVVTLLTDGERTYDVDGELAAAGSVSGALVAAFLDAEFFRRTPPKTTGRERFGRSYARRFVAAGRERGLADADIIASATALTARSVADAYNRFVDGSPDRVIVSGGGARNPTLLSMLRERVDCPVEPLDAHGHDADAKEAMLFALLGVAHLAGVPGNVPGATGARRPVVLGKRSPGT
jgi:anhydro-N-acetylmuramic acid kinase